MKQAALARANGRNPPPARQTTLSALHRRQRLAVHFTGKASLKQLLQAAGEFSRVLCGHTVGLPPRSPDSLADGLLLLR